MSTVYLKTINPHVAKEVGVMAAMVFQHICYWMQTQSTDVIFRTNKDLANDLESISPSQVQRAKKKLIDNGYIKVSNESKYTWVRTTYYRLTEKGQSLRIIAKQSKNTSQNQFKATYTKQEGVSNVEINKTPSSEVKAPESLKNDVVIDLSIDNSKTTCIEDMKIDLSLGCDEETSIVKANKEFTTSEKFVPKHLYAQHMKEKRILEQQNKEFFIPKSMRESFEKAGEIRLEVIKGVPKELLSDPRLAKMIKRKTTIGRVSNEI